MRKKFHIERNHSPTVLSKAEGWQKVAPWYNRITDQGRGHYYHQRVIVPKLLRLLKLQSDSNLLDLACGNGVLAHSLPKSIKYTGVDIAPSLIAEAKRTDHNHLHKYFIGDITNTLNPLITPNFTHATIILALQNIANPKAVFENAAYCLLPNAYFLIVLNHPMFRIPRQSAWGIDEARKIQYRRVDKYMSPMEIPIMTNPSDPNSSHTVSYHFPLSTYISYLRDSGFLVENIEEWTSDKESEGRARRMENRSRAEIPLFMAILAKKI